MDNNYTFYIETLTPDAISMDRLAQYIHNLADLLGYKDAVHLQELKLGSTQLAVNIDNEFAPQVEDRLEQVKCGNGDPKAIKAMAKIGRMLGEDNTKGYIFKDNDQSAKIIDFRDAVEERQATYGPFKQEGTLDGTLISVSGANKIVRIQLQDGDVKYTNIEIDRESARNLAKHMYEAVRVCGTGEWLRNPKGNWDMKKFRIDSFKVLEADDLRDVVKQMRSIEGSEWKKMDDPIDVWEKMRGKDENLQ